MSTGARSHWPRIAMLFAQAGGCSAVGAWWWTRARQGSHRGWQRALAVASYAAAGFSILDAIIVALG